MNDIIVVILPEEFCKVETEAKINERWLGKNVFLPVWSCFIFVKQQGDDKITELCEQYGCKKPITGWLSEFRNLVSGKCNVVRDERIFVPFVNETFIPFSKQLQKINCPTDLFNIEYKLFGMQAPKELHRL